MHCSWESTVKDHTKWNTFLEMPLSLFETHSKLCSIWNSPRRYLKTALTTNQTLVRVFEGLTEQVFFRYLLHLFALLQRSKTGTFYYSPTYTKPFVFNFSKYSATTSHCGIFEISRHLRFLFFVKMEETLKFSDIFNSFL